MDQNSRAQESDHCPACGSRDLEPFHAMRGIPALSCTIWDSREQAENCPKGDIELALCKTCGLLINTAFDSAVLALKIFDKCTDSSRYLCHKVIMPGDVV